jgi:hypothetical protein
MRTKSKMLAIIIMAISKEYRLGLADKNFNKNVLTSPFFVLIKVSSC